MKGKIMLQNEIIEIEKLNREIIKNIERYKKNHKNISKDSIEGKIEELEHKLLSPPIAGHFYDLIQRVYNNPRILPLERLQFQIKKDILNIFKFGKIKKNERRFFLYSIDELNFVERDGYIQEVEYNDIVKQITIGFMKNLEIADEIRKKNKITKKMKKHKMRRCVKSFGFGLTAFLCNGVLGIGFEFSLQVGLTAIYMGYMYLEDGNDMNKSK